MAAAPVALKISAFTAVMLFSFVKELLATKPARWHLRGSRTFCVEFYLLAVSPVLCPRDPALSKIALVLCP